MPSWMIEPMCTLPLLSMRGLRAKRSALTAGGLRGSDQSEGGAIAIAGLAKLTGVVRIRGTFQSGGSTVLIGNSAASRGERMIGMMRRSISKNSWALDAIDDRSGIITNILWACRVDHVVVAIIVNAGRRGPRPCASPAVGGSGAYGGVRLAPLVPRHDAAKRAALSPAAANPGFPGL